MVDIHLTGSVIKWSTGTNVKTETSREDKETRSNYKLSSRNKRKVR